MTKPHPSKRIRQALLDLGFRPLSRGNGQGDHEAWADEQGREIRPLFKGNEMQHPNLYSLGDSLAAQRVCTRREFMSSVRSR
jgi:hypothetical protein